MPLPKTLYLNDKSSELVILDQTFLTRDEI